MAYELIIDKAGVSGYVGKAEKCVYEFSTIPEQVPGESYLAQQLIDQQVAELANESSKLLWIRVWRDISPTWQTNYRVEVYASASPLLWGVIVAGVLAILVLLITSKIVEVVKDIDWGKAAAPIVASSLVLGAIILGGLYLAGRKRT